MSKDLIDITIPVDENIISWNDRHSFSRTVVASQANGDKCNESVMKISCHEGTHVDAPFHFRLDGKKIDEIDSDLLIGECFVAYVPNKKVVTRADLEDIVPEGVIRLLLRTDNSDGEMSGKFNQSYCSVDESAVEFMHERGIRLFGVDYLSIGQSGNTAPVHKLFFSHNDNVALEGLWLKNVQGGMYILYCLPLLLKGSDGAPARVFIKKI